MAEQHLTFRALASRSRLHDVRGRGLSFTYLGNVAKGSAAPSVEAIEIIAATLDLDAEAIAEYRLARLRALLDPQVVGLDAALDALPLVEHAISALGEDARARGRSVPGPPAGGAIERLIRGRATTPRAPGQSASELAKRGRRSA